MKSVELSQEELRVLLASLNALIQHGNIQLGDAFKVVPIALKLQSKIELSPEEKKAVKPN